MPLEGVEKPVRRQGGTAGHGLTAWVTLCAHLTVALRPNEVWSVDCKGWFRTGDGTRVDPLTTRVFNVATVGLPATGGWSGDAGNLDVNRPLLGKEFWDVGAMVVYQRRIFANVNLRTKLNIQNLPNWQTPRLAKSDYDTNAVYGTTNAVVPILWELRRPRNYVLTATFEF